MSLGLTQVAVGSAPTGSSFTTVFFPFSGFMEQLYPVPSGLFKSNSTVATEGS